jgi:molecular chaperone GrpE
VADREAPSQEEQDEQRRNAPVDEAFAEEGAESDALQAEVAQYKDLALRAQAELENARKRLSRELADERKYANIHLMRDLLPVLDNMDRAIEAASKSPEGTSLLEGFHLVVQQFRTILAQHHCQPIEAAGQMFDPNFHEAVLQQPSAEHAAGQVMLVTQQGYQLHDRVVRPAQVVVSQGPE